MRVPSVVYVTLGLGLALAAGVPGAAAAQVPRAEPQPRVAVPARGAVIQTAAPTETVAPATQPPGPPTTTPAATAPAEPAPVTAVTGTPAGVTPVGTPPPATASSSQAATAGRQSYTAGKFGLTLGGGQIAWLKSVEGGTASSEVVVEKGGPDAIAAKHIAGVKYKDIALETDFQSQLLNDWIAASWKGNPSRKSGSIQNMDFDYKVVSELEFMNALVTETTMPALDAASKDAARIVVKLSPEYTRAKAGSGAKNSGSLAGPMQKKWLLSNFRFEMAGLDASRVNKIDAFTVRQVIAENPVGELRDYQKEPSTIEFPNLKITLAAPHAATWTAWHEDFVVKGNNGPGQERNGAIIYFDPSMKSQLGRVNLMNCGIFGLAPLKSEAGSEAIPRVAADLYCERMEFVTNNAAK